MGFRLTQANFDPQTERAYVEFRDDDSDGGEVFAVVVFSYRTKSRLSTQLRHQEIVRKARHALKRAAVAT
jgi:predicted RNA binding protein with dsRBD fold (UPF0201 family)